MEGKPGFFPAGLGENDGLWNSGGWRTISRLRGSVRDDHMLIQINPPLIGQRYGLADKDIVNLVLSSRFEGDSLFPVKQWPCHVYISRILDEKIEKTLEFTRDQVEIIAWGIMFRALDEANRQSGSKK